MAALDTESALDAFLASVERKAFIMAQMSTRNEEDALDIVQDAMLAFVRRYTSRPQGEWKPIFYRILQNRIRDWNRKKALRNRILKWFSKGERGDGKGEGPLEELADPNPSDPVDALMSKDIATTIANAVAELPLRQQQSFLLRTWEEMDVAQTAYVMGCSEGSVKTHYSRAIKALRKELGEYWP